MTKAELINIIAEKNGFFKKDCEDIVNEIFELISERIVEDGKVAIPGFGSFVIEQRPERAGFNPRTREKIKIPARKVLKFRPMKNLREKVKDMPA